MAEKWLSRRGLTPLLRNYSCGAGELDLVMRSENQLIIIEVKYRRHGALVSGPESVTHAKQKRIALATLHLLQTHPHLSALPVRFDLASVTGFNDRQTLEWIRDAFRPAL